MKTKNLTIFILIFALTGCGESPRKDTHKKDAVRQEVSGSVDTTTSENVAGMSAGRALVGKKMSVKYKSGGYAAPSAVALTESMISISPPQPEWNRESYNAVTENGHDQ